MATWRPSSLLSQLRGGAPTGALGNADREGTPEPASPPSAAAAAAPTGFSFTVPPAAHTILMSRLRVPLACIGIASAVALVVIFVGYAHSDFSHCVVPASCTNVLGLNGTFPRTGGGLCLLTEAEAAAMLCPTPAGTARNLTDGNCTAIAGSCDPSVPVYVSVAGAGATCTFVLLLALVGAGRCWGPLRGICVGLVLSATVGPLLLTCIGAALLVGTNRRAIDEGRQHVYRSNDMVRFASVDCFDQDAVRLIEYADMPSSLAAFAWITVVASVLLAVLGCLYPVLLCFWAAPRARRASELDLLADSTPAAIPSPNSRTEDIVPLRI